MSKDCTVYMHQKCETAYQYSNNVELKQTNREKLCTSTFKSRP